MSKLMFLSIASVFLLAPACVLGGCSAPASEAPENPEQTGSLQLPLLSQVGEHTYRLSGGYLYVTGSSYQYVDLGADAPVVSVALSSGNYVAYLYGASLLRDDGTGRFVPVVANLVSNNGVPFEIYNGTTSTIAFQFETDGALVTIGSGKLNVRLEVSEGSAACTPFGSDCAEGSWCPPTELTGTARACVGAGPARPKEACGRPSDCVAGSSCFDFGLGGVCAELCPSSQFGQPCGDDSECVAAGAEYGVCTPASPPVAGAAGSGG